VDILLEHQEDTSKEEATSTTKAPLPTLLELTLQEEAELDKEKPSTELQESITEDTLLAEVELEHKTTNINDCRYDFILSILDIKYIKLLVCILKTANY
jgi:hypothetical protein